MIIVRAPLRVSFFGGGTDLPAWFKHWGPGAVLSTSINQYVYITIRPLPPIFDYRYRVVWRVVEQCSEISEIRHPVVREVLREFAPPTEGGFEIVYHADLPARSGLGSSSAFTVAALHALFSYGGEQTSKMRLTREAIRVEQELLREPVGSQDQTAIAHGGLNQIDFCNDGSIEVDPVDITTRRKLLLESHLMMFFTGFTREAGGIEKQKADNFAARRPELLRMYEMVGRGRRILENPFAPIDDFGAILDEAWQAKKSLAKAVSNGPIDALYDAAIKAGAIGGKLLGAGGGGFLLFFVPPERQEAVTRSVQALDLGDERRAVPVPIRMEDEGSSVVLRRPDFEQRYEDSYAKIA